MVFATLHAPPRSGRYIEQVAMDLGEALDTARFLDAWNAVVHRHDALRIHFSFQPEIAQHLQDAIELPVSELNWEDKAPEAQDSDWEALLAADRARGFDLTRPPLHRLTLVRLGHARYRSLWTVHHALLDGRSMALVVREVFTLYDAFVRDAQVSLLPAPAFAEHARRNASLDPRAARDFWRERFRGFSEPNRLPVREAPGDADEFQYETESLELTLPKTRALAEFAQAQSITVHTLLKGAWALTLGRHSGRNDVVFGVTKSVRHHITNADAAVGLYINTLPVRVQLDEALAVGDWLRRVRDEWVALRPHELTPANWIATACDVPPGVALYETYLVYERDTFDAQVHAGVSGPVSRNFTLHERTPSPLTLAAYGGSSLTLAIEFDAGLYDRSYIRALLDRFTLVLENLSRDAAAPLRDVRFLTDADRRMLLEEWQGPPPGEVPDEPVHRAFERMAESRPNAVAVEQGGAGLTYAELNARANAVARVLRARGFDPGDPVGVCLPREPELIAAILGTLKAGSPYVPLLPELPQTRIDYMIENAGIRAVVAHAELQERFPDVAHFIAIEEALAAPVSDGTEPPSAVAPDALAYIMYTSGSTGTPKGVMVEHRSLNAFLAAVQPLYGIGTDDRVLQFASIGFDTAIEEIFPALTRGATLVLRTEDMLTHAQAFLDACRDQRITVLDLPTAYWHLLTESVATAKVPDGVRLVIIGGEAARADCVTEWHRHVDIKVQLINTYGPTETTVVATAAVLDPGSAVMSGGVSIGRPLPGMRACVLDECRRLVPPGTEGELYLSGPQLARGYVDAEDVTARQFVTCPDVAEGRFYKTGDRVRHGADGRLAHLGRTDRQVKVRGYRVELDEIENVLVGHAAVTAAAVLYEAEGIAPRQLIAYVVPASGHGGEELLAELRDWAQEKLPSFMQPQRWTLLESMPLTPSGKIDRKALPRPDRPARAVSVDPPASDTEARTQRIWEEVFRVPVGCGEAFLDIGGDSLKAVQIAARVMRDFGIEVPVAFFTDNATVRKLAERLSAAPAAGERYRGIPPCDRNAAVPLTFDQQVVWLFETVYPGTQTYHIPVVYRLAGPFEPEILRVAVNEVIRRHESLRTVFDLEGKHPVQRVADPYDFVMPVVSLESLPGPNGEPKIFQFLSDFVSRPFDIRKIPLLRGTVLRVSPTDHVVCFTFHHIVTDGWSVGVFVKELIELYAARREGRSPRLPVLTVQYADYAVWQRKQFEDHGDATVAYWLEHLKAPLNRIDWPKDATPPEEDPRQGAQYPVEISPELSDTIRRFAAGIGSTPFKVLLSLFNLVIYRYTGCTDIVVGATQAHRNRVEIEPLIGFFISTVAIRSRVDARMTYAEFLEQVRVSVRGAQEHADMPFERIREAVEPNPDSDPFMQVLFLMQTVDLPPLVLPGTRAKTLNIDLGKSILDLTLELYDTPNGFRGWFEYCTDMFSRPTVARLARCFEQFAELACTYPQTPLASLPEFSAIETGDVVPPVLWEVPLAPRMHARAAKVSTVHEQDPRTAEIEQKLIAIWRRVLATDAIARDSDFFRSGGDSLAVLVMLAQVEEIFGRRIPPMRVYQGPLLAQLALLLAEGAELVHPDAIHPIQPAGVRPPLFFVGSIANLPNVAEGLPGDQPVYGLGVFGLRPSEEQVRHVHVEDIAAAFIEDIVRLQPQGPYYLGGYCRDAIVAYEIAQQLTRRGERVAALLIVDLVWSLSDRYSWSRRHWQNFREMGWRYIAGKIGHRWRAFLASMRYTWLRRSRKVLRRPDAKDPQRLADSLFLTAYNNAVDAYQPEPYPGPVTLIVCSEWGVQTAEEWEWLAGGGVRVREFASRHDDLWDSPQIENLAAAIHYCLDEAQRKDPETVAYASGQALEEELRDRDRRLRG
jgi:amino acid adenylation domain-containing protein